MSKLFFWGAITFGLSNTVFAASADTTRGPYRPSVTRTMDLTHTELHVRFDWENERVSGKAVLWIRPYFYPRTTAVIDAKGFDIHAVYQVEQDREGKREVHRKLPYTYNQRQLTIALGKEYTRKDTLAIGIEYIAKPSELTRLPGEEHPPEKGLFFINADGGEVNKPRQIWTQGETDGNSTWFPTIDAPNEKFTQDFYLTVDTTYQTLSNGLLTASRQHDDGTRTDHWKQTLPHAPYLAMVAVGHFAVVRDTLPGGLELSYYVEPAYKPYARAIFGRTPEMLRFFTECFGMPYPWEKYAQIAVRDFVSGAMENTTATVHEEGVLMDHRALLDGNSDGVIAHELAHHWFGNLVTCEAWGQLPLNESFANYSEYLWYEHRYGREDADWSGAIEWQRYLTESEEKKVPMIRSFYHRADDMFDSHSYAKGGRILHMLRKQVGDEAFFEALRLYLRKHRFGTTEIADLRLAFEEVTGEDLNWFFEQWFFRPGHPELDVSHEYQEAGKKVVIRVRQKQEKVYRLPVKLDSWQGGTKTQQLLVIDQPDQVFEFAAAEKPDLVYFDPEHRLPAVIHHPKSTRELLFQWRQATSALAKLEAMTALESELDSEDVREAFEKALSDPFWRIRQQAVALYGNTAAGRQKAGLIAALAVSDSSALVRAEAVVALSREKDGQYESLFRSALNDSSYAVVTAALDACLSLRPADARQLIERFDGHQNPAVLVAIGNYYGDFPEPEYLEWFRTKLTLLNDSGKYYLMQVFGKYLIRSGADVQRSSLPYIEQLAREHTGYLVRFGAYQLLDWLSGHPGVPETLRTIREQEQHPDLLKLYQEMQGN